MKCKIHLDLIGFVGRDPDVYRRPDGSVLAVRFGFATTERWRDGNGELKERTEWHRVVFWDRNAEQIANSVRGGALLEIEGSLQSSKYERDGITRTSWQVRGKDYRLFPRTPGEPAPASGADEPAPDGSDIPL